MNLSLYFVCERTAYEIVYNSVCQNSIVLFFFTSYELKFGFSCTSDSNIQVIQPNYTNELKLKCVMLIVPNIETNSDEFCRNERTNSLLVSGQVRLILCIILFLFLYIVICIVSSTKYLLVIIFLFTFVYVKFYFAFHCCYYFFTLMWASIWAYNRSSYTIYNVQFVSEWGIIHWLHLFIPCCSRHYDRQLSYSWIVFSIYLFGCYFG